MMRRRSRASWVAAVAMLVWSASAAAQEAGAAPAPPPPSAAPVEPPPSAAETAPPPSDAAAVAEPEAIDQADPTLAPTSSFVGDPWGDEPANLVAGPISLRVLLQTRYLDTFAKHSKNPRAGYALREDVLVHDRDGFELQRFFFRLAADPTPWVGFRAVIDFADLRGSNISNVLKQAYATLRPIPTRFEIAAGIFNLPYSTLELDPVARFELSDLGSADDFAKQLGFAGRDVGVEVMIAPLERPRWLRVSLGAFRGHADDEHASPIGAIGARVESKPIQGFRVGADMVGMPFSADYKRPFETSGKEALPTPPDPMYPYERRWAGGKAYSADLTYSRDRFMARAEGMLGDRVDIDLRYGARSFWSAWAIVAYRIALAEDITLLPALRAEWLDSDREHDNGLRRELSAGVSVMYKENVRFLVDVKRTDVQADTPVLEQPEPIPFYPYLELDNTRVFAQAQLVF
jgi:hypothetical protein